MPAAAKRPSTPYVAPAARQPISAASRPTPAAMAALPTSPEKLYVPRAARRPPSSYAFDTSDEESGCWTPDARPAASSTASSETNPVAQPAAMKPSAVTAVPAARSPRSPQRSARKPAGIWNADMPPVYAVRIMPTCAKLRPNSAAQSGRNT